MFSSVKDTKVSLRGDSVDFYGGRLYNRPFHGCEALSEGYWVCDGHGLT